MPSRNLSVTRAHKAGQGGVRSTPLGGERQGRRSGVRVSRGVASV